MKISDIFTEVVYVFLKGKKPQVDSGGDGIGMK